jgi:hypothetical protein
LTTTTLPTGAFPSFPPSREEEEEEERAPSTIHPRSSNLNHQIKYTGRMLSTEYGKRVYGTMDMDDGDGKDNARGFGGVDKRLTFLSDEGRA